MQPTRKINTVLTMLILASVAVNGIKASEPGVAGRRTLYSKVWEWKNYRAGRPQYIEHNMHRAGHPDQISSWAALPRTSTVQGYWVGGGAGFGHSLSPMADEGTWGWDKTGSNLIPRRVRLGFTNGKLYQGGMGSYETDHKK